MRDVNCDEPKVVTCGDIEKRMVVLWNNSSESKYKSKK